MTKKYETIDISSGGDLAMRFLYNTFFGRVLLKLFVNVYASKLAGCVLNSRASKIFIGKFIKSNNIDMSEYKEVKYKSFNDFFTREAKESRRPFSNNKRELPSPCDAKLTAYKITGENLFSIKKTVYDVKSLLLDDKLANEYTGGACLIFRLTPDDYHRYCFIDDGEILAHKKIRGIFHTVRPVALKRYKVFAQNAREYTVMQTQNFGKAIQIEIGAMLVGKICNHKTSGTFSRGEEKGMFEYGGSTILLLFKNDAVTIDENIFMNTAANKETIVRMGEGIGKAI